MNFQPPLFNVALFQGGNRKTHASSISESTNTNFDFVEVDLKKTKLTQKWIDLIEIGKGVEKYNNDHSRAILSSCLAMINSSMNDQEIISVLTDKKNYLAETAFRHVNSSSRLKAANWLFKYSLKKAKSIVEQSSFSKDENQISRELNLTFEEFKDISVDTNESYLIKDYIDKESFVVVFGESNSGKTFFAIDLSLHVALGKSFFERDVQGGPVLYVAAEGGRRIKDRFVAVRKAHRLENEEVPLILARGTINLLDPKADVKLLIDQIKNTKNKFGSDMALVVVDTLNRAFAGGDENQSEDMGSFIRNIDTIRAETKAAVLVVHHSGKGKDRGARGHSSLRAAVDTEIEVIAKQSGAKYKQEKIKIAQTKKQRDYDFGKPLGFKLKNVLVYKRKNGTEINSCVVEQIDLASKDEEKSEILVDSVSDKGFKVLKEIFRKHSIVPPKELQLRKGLKVVPISVWKNAFFEKHYHDRAKSTRYDAFKRAIQELENFKKITVKAGYVWLEEQK